MLAGKIGLLYSGQGSQVKGLGKDFYDEFLSVREIYNAYPDIRDLSFYADEEVLRITKNTQPVLILFHIAITNLLKGFLDYDAVMGLSLGEYGALYGAEVLSRENVVDIVKLRANSMTKASSGLNLSSLAVISDDFDFLLKNIGADTYYVSNINSPKQVIITGENLERKIEFLNAHGYKKIIPLAVSGGFHSPYMINAEKDLKKAFENIDFSDPKVPVFFSYGDENIDIKTRLAKQVSNTIDVNSSLTKISNYCDILIEIGANKILQSLVKKIDKEKHVFPIQTVEDFEKVRESFGK